MKYQHIVSEVFRRPWAIQPEKLQTIVDLILLRASGEKLTDEEIQARIGVGAAAPSARSVGSIAVIPIYGVISQRMNLMSDISGGTSVEQLTSAYRTALNDSEVKAIVFDVDSPGGAVSGIPELAAEILAGRKSKKTVAVANAMAGSAAYWLAASAGEVVVVPSGLVGSIGVIAAHEDMSKAMETEGVKVSLITAGKYKADGNPYEPLSETARADLQAKVDEFYGMFVKSVAKGRSTSQETVRTGFGEARMVTAADAVSLGMADSIATLDQTLERLGARPPSSGRTPRAQLEREFALINNLI